MAATVVPLSPFEVAEMAQFFASQIGDSAERVRERLDWLAANPALRDDIPFAIGARSAGGDLVGAMLCVPYRFALGGRDAWAVMSSGFYVDASARGAGLQIFLRYRALGDRFLLYTTTANQEAAALWKAMSAAPIPKTDYELLRPLRLAGAVENVASRRIGRAARALSLALAPIDAVRVLLARGDDRELRTVARAEEAASAPSPSDGLELVRDEPFLRWRYFQIPQDSARVFALDRAGSAPAFVAVTSATRGYRSQLRCRYVADLWGHVSDGVFETALRALAARESADADLLAIRSFPDVFENTARTAGFRTRAFTHSIGWYFDERRLTGERWIMPPAASEIV